MFERVETALRNGGWCRDLIATVGSIPRPPTPLMALAAAIDCMDASRLFEELRTIMIESPSGPVPAFAFENIHNGPTVFMGWRPDAQTP